MASGKDEGFRHKLKNFLGIKTKPSTTEQSRVVAVKYVFDDDKLKVYLDHKYFLVFC